MVAELAKQESPIVSLRKFFGHNTARPVQVPEMMGFWAACTPEEKEQFKAEVGKWDGESTFIS